MLTKIDDLKSVLIIGMAGGLAKITAGLLAKQHPKMNITGIDPRYTDTSSLSSNIDFRRIKYTRGNFEKLFREKQFDLVLHLGRMSHANANPISSNLTERLNLNLMGTKRVLDLCLKFCVKKVMILSTYHVYGALSDNPVFLNEDAQLRASFKYPELRDVVEMDQMSTNWMWKNQADIETIVLRPSTIIGPQINNTMTKYLTTSYVPICADFNPMFQFIHEFDMANIIIKCIGSAPTGIYNVSSDEVISIKQAKKLLNKKAIAVPSIALTGAAKLLSSTFWNFPRYLIDYIKFSCIIDNSALKAQLGDDIFEFNINDTFQMLKES